MKGLAEPDGVISQSYTLAMQPTAVWPFTPWLPSFPISAAFVKDKERILLTAAADTGGSAVNDNKQRLQTSAQHTGEDARVL